MASKHVISQDSDTSFEVTEDGSSWIVKKGVTLDVDSDYVFDNFTNQADNVEFVIAGQLGGAGSTMFVGIVDDGTDNRFELTETGSITGGYRGIYAIGQGAEIVNAGTLSGSVAGLQLGQADFLVRNSGLITTSDMVKGDAIIVDSSLGNGKIVNLEGGAIEGNINLMSSGSVTFNNKGTMGESGHSASNGSLGYLADHFLNSGTINGSFYLGAGGDTADLRGGTVTGTVFGDEGDDVYIVNSDDQQAYEYAGEGTDTLRTSVSFNATQTGEIENFVAIGKGKVNITANIHDNKVIGNNGKNVLDGGSGDDTLRGHDGADTFVFSTGKGDDRIMDFDNGKDRIDVTGWNNIDDFADIEVITDVSGKDLVLTLGADELTLRNTKLSELDATDFIF